MTQEREYLDLFEDEFSDADYLDLRDDDPGKPTLAQPAGPTPSTRPLQTLDGRFNDDLQSLTSRGLTIGADGYESEDHVVNDSAYAGRSIALSALMRSAVMSAGVVARTCHDDAVFPVHFGRSIHFFGYRLYQQDFLLQLRIADILRGRSTSDGFEMRGLDLIRWMGWSASTYSTHRLHGSLLSLARARFELTTLSFERTRFRLFDALCVENGMIIGKLSGGLVKFQDAVGGTPRGTYIPLDRWRSLRPGLETWLGGWVLATQCDAPVSIKTLYDHCGTCHKSIAEFGRDVRRALERLEAVGIVSAWTPNCGNRLTRGFVTIKKPTRPR